MLFSRKRRNADSKRNLLSGRTPSRVTSARQRALRCEPLEDRRMLSITLFSNGGDGLNDLQTTLPPAIALHAAPEAVNNVNQIGVAEEAAQPSEKLLNDEALVDSDTVAGDTAKSSAYSGTTYIVESLSNTIANDGVLTFIEAFQASNYNQSFGDAAAGSSVYQDVIRFASGLSGTVSVTSEFIVNDDLSIEGPGAGLLTFSGGYSSRVFFIQPSVNASFSGMTVTAGYSDYGGAIYCSNSSSLTITDSTLSGNSASNDGGAIYNYAGTLSLVNSTVSGSSGYNGAGIYNYGSLTVTNSTFSNNSASNDGGAICNSSSTVSVTGSTFSNNSAVGFGGAIDTYSGTITISGSTFSSNSAAYGAAVDNYSSTTSITSSSLINNSASQYGGGVYNYTGQLTVVNSTLSGNSTLYYGGGICNYVATLKLTNSTISDNTSRDYSNGAGGGIYSGDSTSSATLNNTIVAGNTAAYGDDIYCYEGGLYGSHSFIGNGSSQSALTNGYNGNQIGSTYYPIDPMLGDLIQFDNGLWGYDIAADSPAVDAGLNSLAVTATGLLLSEDIAGNDRIVNSTVDIGATEYCVDEIPAQTYVVTSLANTIANDGVLTFIEAFQAANTNLPVGDAQAGSDTEQDTIQFAPGLTGTVLVNDGKLTINDDLAIEGPGSELLTFDAEYENSLFLIQTDVVVAFRGMTITHGSTGGGGGIYNKGTLTLTDVSVSDNEVDSYGGGIYNYYGTITLNNSTVANNLAKERISGGGGIYNRYGSLTIANSTISGNSVTFEAYNEGGGIYNSGTLAISNSTISANSINGYGGGIYNKGTLSIEDSTLSENSMLVGGSGGAIYNEEDSTATIANSSLINNSSDERGGAIQNFGEMTISDSLFSGNSDSSTGGGGAINNYSGSLIITKSTFEGNQGESGGGIYNNSDAILNISNSTFANNTASSGGGIFNTGSMVVTNCTLSNNSAAYGGGLRDYNSDSGVLNNCIVAGNWATSRGPEIDHSTYYNLSGSNNVIGNGTGQSAFTDGVDGNQVGTSSDVSSLLSEWSQFDNGLWGFYLMPGSSAINAGNNSLAVDADGQTLSEDISGNTRIVGGTVDIGAIEGSGTNIPSQIYVVTSLEMTIADDGILTFKEAFEAAQANRSIGDAPAGSYSEQDVIRFTPGLSGTIILDEGALSIDTRLAIEGSGAEFITFDAQGQSGVFSIEKNCNACLSGITITGGAAYSGAGITNEGTLVVEDVILRDNSAENCGGAIYNYRGVLTVTNSTIAGNSAVYKGGGIRNQLGTLTITNSAIVNNSPSGVHCDGSSSSTTLNNTIVAGNVGTSYASDVYQESGHLYGSHNLIGNGSKQTSLVDSADGNMVGTSESPFDPLLSDWTQSENGLWGYYPLPGSPVLDAGDNSLALDSAGQPITEDMDGNTRIQNTIVDLGPLEGSILANSAQVYLVTSLEESIATDGVLTFLEAFEAAKRNQPVGDAPAGSCIEQDVIQFADTLSGTIAVAGKEITLFGKLSIEGPGSDQLIFDAGEQNRVFHVRPNASISLSGLTVTGGSADMGGGIFNDAANLTLTRLVVSDNSASLDGGGIYNLGTLTVRNSTIADNSANRSGGGIYTKNSLAIVNSEILDNSGIYGGGICNNYYNLDIVNTAFLRNQASYGGGIRNLSGTMTITNSTIADNSAYDGGGIENPSSSAHATLNNTIVASNSGEDFYNNGGSLYGSSNLIGNGTGQSDLVDGVDGNQIGSSTTPIDPMLDEAGYPQTNSPVIDSGDNSLVPTGVTTDIAGNDRIQNGTVDIGAYETESLTPRMPGDANSDGKVDGSDVTILAGNWQVGVNDGKTATWSMGDFNGDHKVDGPT